MLQEASASFSSIRRVQISQTMRFWSSAVMALLNAGQTCWHYGLSINDDLFGGQSLLVRSHDEGNCVSHRQVVEVLIHHVGVEEEQI